VAILALEHRQAGAQLQLRVRVVPETGEGQSCDVDGAAPVEG
jgi:hypothetical protein